MLIENQKVMMKWNFGARRLYDGEKYKYTFEKDDFEIDVADLSPGSGVRVWVLCDLCKNNKYQCAYNNYVRTMKDIKDTDDICPSCVSYLSENKDECFKLILDKKLKSAPKGCSGTFSDIEIINIINYLASILKYSGEIESPSDLIRKLNKPLLQKYGLSSLLKNRTVYEILKPVFEDVQPWELGAAPMNFWNEKDNIEKVRVWFIDKLYKREIIKEPKDIRKVPMHKVTQDLGICYLYFKIFNGSRYRFCDFLFPDTFNEWDFPVSNNFYKNDDNKKRALLWLVESLIKDGKIKVIDDLPNYITFNTFEEYNLRWLVVSEFASSPFHCISYCFPDRWTLTDFNRPLTLDGTLVDSKEEARIHDWLLENIGKENVQYTGLHKAKNLSWYNEKENETYFVDWIINKNTIIEYFGYYNTSNNQNKIFVDYKDKTRRKIEFFSKLKNYNFLALFPIDLKRNFEGLKNKIFEHCKEAM